MITAKRFCQFSFLFFLLFLIFVPKTIQAQETISDSGLNLTTSPLPINLITSPGVTVSAQLKIKNGGTQTEKLAVGLMKFDAYGDDGMPRLMDRQGGDDFFDWVTFSEDTFEVLPNQWKTITATFSLPPSAAFGYYYAVTFSRADQSPSTPGQTAIAGATATLVLVEARVDNAQRDIEVIDFTSDRTSYEFLPVSFNLKLKNKGNVHVAPRGNIFIDKGSKHDLAILEINQLGGNVLPDSNRVFVTTWNDGFPLYVNQVEEDKVVLDKLGRAKKKLNWDFSQTDKFRWGKYTAKMLLVYDDGIRDVPIEAKLSFWLIPWRFIIALTLVISLTVIGLWSSLKKLFSKLFKRKKPDLS